MTDEDKDADAAYQEAREELWGELGRDPDAQEIHDWMQSQSRKRAGRNPKHNPKN